MSLLGSIFGSDAKGDDDRKSLFEASQSLPDRPQHKPAERSARKKKKQIPAEEEEDLLLPIQKGGNAEEETTPKVKKPRKPKKSKEEQIPNEDGNEQVAAGEEEQTIYVGNLPLSDISRKGLAKLFADCGPIKSTRIRNIPVTGIKLPPSQAGNQALMRKVCVNTGKVDLETTKSIVQGYVVFESKDSVPKALLKNNILKVNGRILRVDKATPTVEPTRSVFCGNLPYSTDESTLQKHFERGCSLEKGDIEGVRIIRDKDTHKCKGFGYVLLRDKSLVVTALKMHGTTYKKKELRVLVCGKRFKGRQGQQQAKDLPPHKRKTSAGAASEQVTAGAFRRVLGKQATEATGTSNVGKQRKRGIKRKSGATANTSGVSKRVASEKKTEKRVKKLEKRMVKGMGKTKAR